MVKTRGATIPVNVYIEGKKAILDLTEMKKILENAKTIAIGDCACRTRVKKCNAPLDVCFSLDKTAEDRIKKGSVSKVSLEQALDTLKRSHEAGLVHITYTLEGKEKPKLVCSCCSCCCSVMRKMVRTGMPDVIATSKYVAQNNEETCINCGKCVERCQFKARSIINAKLVFNKAGCFGCGLCVSTCPTKSISLVSRQAVA